MSDYRTETLNNQILISINDAARLTGLAPSLISAAIKSGELKAGKIGQGWRIRRAELDSWLDYRLRSGQ